MAMNRRGIVDLFRKRGGLPAGNSRKIRVARGRTLAAAVLTAATLVTPRANATAAEESAHYHSLGEIMEEHLGPKNTSALDRALQAHAEQAGGSIKPADKVRKADFGISLIIALLAAAAGTKMDMMKKKWDREDEKERIRKRLEEERKKWQDQNRKR